LSVFSEVGRERHTLQCVHRGARSNTAIRRGAGLGLDNMAHSYWRKLRTDDSGTASSPSPEPLDRRVLVKREWHLRVPKVRPVCTSRGVPTVMRRQAEGRGGTDTPNFEGKFGPRIISHFVIVNQMRNEGNFRLNWNPLNKPRNGDMDSG